jgi:trigger factor
VDKILKDENIVATPEEIDEKIKEQAKNMNKDFEEYKKTINERQMSYFENNATIEKLFNFLRENNKID